MDSVQLLRCGLENLQENLEKFPRLDVEDLQVSVHHRKSQVGQHCVEMCSKV